MVEYGEGSAEERSSGNANRASSISRNNASSSIATKWLVGKEKDGRRTSRNQRSETMHTYKASRKDHFPDARRSRPCSSTQVVPFHSAETLAGIKMPNFLEEDGLASLQNEVAKGGHVFHEDE